MARIVSIVRKKIGSETLWNLAVEGDESFIANGIVVHNCKSYISAILIGNLGNKQIEDLNPSKTAQKSVQFSESSIDFLLTDIAKPRPGNLQTIIISKDEAKSAEEAKKIAKEVGATHLDYDETESSFRFRQRNPSDFEDSSFHSFPISGRGATLVYGKLKA